MKKLGILSLATIVLGTVLYLSFIYLSSEAAKAEAIRQAEQYNCPTGMGSTMEMKPATHKATGAEYTFGGCVAPGWEY